MDNSERGSVSPVFIMLLLVAILLLGAMLDREWVNYKLHLAEEIADFAAESGARTAQVWDTVQVRRYQIQYTSRKVCDDVPCSKFHFVLDSSVVRSVVPLPATEEKQLLRDWKTMAGCGGDPEEPNWACQSVEVLGREIRYPPQTAARMEQVFRQNWQDQPLARVVGVFPEANRNQRTVHLRTQIELRSVTGLVGWWNTVTIEGAAATQIDPLDFSIP